MEKAQAESTPSRTQPTSEEPFKSVESEGKDDGSRKELGKTDSDPGTSAITNEQWRAMMDIVMNIYEYREKE